MSHTTLRDKAESETHKGKLWSKSLNFNEGQDILIIKKRKRCGNKDNAGYI